MKVTVRKQDREQLKKLLMQLEESDEAELTLLPDDEKEQKVMSYSERMADMISEKRADHPQSDDELSDDEWMAAYVAGEVDFTMRALTEGYITLRQAVNIISFDPRAAEYFQEMWGDISSDDKTTS